MTESQFTAIVKKLKFSESRKFAAYNKIFSKKATYEKLAEIYGVDKAQIHRDVKTVKSLYEWAKTTFTEAGKQRVG